MTGKRIAKGLRNRSERIPAWVFTAIVLVAILWLTLAPHPLGEEELPAFPGADKLVHALMFGGLTAAVCFDWCRTHGWGRIRPRLVWLFAALSAAMGVGIEFVQAAMQLGRSFEPADMAADAAGAFLTAAIWLMCQKKPVKKPDVMDSPAKATSESGSEASDSGEPEDNKPKKKKMAKWLKVTLWVVASIVIFILLLPVIVYIPPVQTALKDIACSVVKDKTGMDVKIDRFRLKFPLDVSLQGVSAVEAGGDTLASVKELIADVKLLPLLHLDAQVKRLELLEGYYHMVSPDSSMIMNLRAGRLDVDSKSSADIKNMRILLNKVRLSKADISLYMDVWKKKPTPPDSVTPSTPFYISLADLEGSDIKFRMWMLPTIDSLGVEGKEVRLKNAVIDLGANTICADALDLGHGSFAYVAPTAEYQRTHPAPIDTITPPSPPMKISAKHVGIADVSGLYGIKGARPAAGFDPNFVQVSGVNIQIEDFYNEQTTLVLPIRSISARERCGLQITEGAGTFRLDSAGMALQDLRVRTPYSRIDVTADLPFALMELQPQAPVNVKADMSLGLADAFSFMPDMKRYASFLPTRTPLQAKLAAKGTLADVAIPQFDLSMAGLFSLSGKGFARNALDFKRLVASVDLDGQLRNPSLADRFLKGMGVKVPPFRLKGSAKANRDHYSLDMALTTPHGDVAAKGGVALNAERYDADLTLRSLNVAEFISGPGVGPVSGHITAHGAGFDPSRPGAATEFTADISEIVYNHKSLRNIYAEGELSGGDYRITARSPNECLNLDLDLEGQLAPDLYSAKGHLAARDVDLKALGLSQDECRGYGDIYINATASPARWLYDVDLDVRNLEWNIPGTFIHLPDGMQASLTATADSVAAHIDSDLTYLDLKSATGLQAFVDAITKVSDIASSQIAERRIDVDTLQQLLPPLDLTLNASGKGLVKQLLQNQGMGIDTLYCRLSNDSLISGRLGVLGLSTSALDLDTVTLDLGQRARLLDYKIHVGNQPGTFDEFAQVDASGYLGANRASLFLRQRNLKGEMGYRIGFTASISPEDVVSLHFTPLKATIAYLPWTINSNNYLDYNLKTMTLGADLQASNKESSIYVKTENNDIDDVDLLVNLTNIHVQDFTSLMLDPPPLKANLNSDIQVRYAEGKLSGKGTLGLTDFYYDKKRVGDLNLNLDAGVNFNGDSELKLGLDIDGHKNAARLDAVLGAGEETTDAEGNKVNGPMEPKGLDLVLDKFPLRVANPFLGPDVASLSGYLNGKMDLSGSMKKPLLNGAIACDSVKVYVPFVGSSLRFDTVPITVQDNILDFDRFDVWGANSNPLTLDGSVDATDFSKMKIDLNLNASNFQVMNNDSRSRSDLFGKLFLNLNASATGNLKLLDVKANATVLGKSDITYRVSQADQAALTQTDRQLVKFVSFNDTTQVARADSIPPSMQMRLSAGITIQQGTAVTVLLSGNSRNQVDLNPSGTLNFYRNYMGDMRLNGQLNTGAGMARYAVPVMGEKQFELDPQSYVLWNGELMNPVLNISATDKVRASVSQNGGNTRLVNFIVTLSAAGSLSQPKVNFDLSTNDDMSLQNELQSMSADQRQQQAMNMLITGSYSGVGMKTTTGPITGNVYSFLASQLNSWAAKTIRGVDLSFGVDQYDSRTDGRSSTTTSYSYEVSKSLFNNRFKINVGGNYSTDASADENLAQNLISNISFDYTLKQTQSMTMLVKLFRHMDYESILEGEITEMGVGFVMRRRINNLWQIFSPIGGERRRREKEEKKAREDSIKAARDAGQTIPSPDSISYPEPQKGGDR